MKLKIILYCLLMLSFVQQAVAWNWGDEYTRKYSDYMILTSVLLDKEGNNIGSPDIELVAFHGNEVRGVCSPAWDEGKYVYYMQIYGNPGDVASVTVKAFYKLTGEPVIIEEEGLETEETPINTDVPLGATTPTQIQQNGQVALQAIAVEEAVQTYEVGRPATFKLTTTPAGIDDITVSYWQKGTAVTPSAAGSYDVLLTRAEDATYQPFRRMLKNALVIGLRAPEVTWPSGLTLEEGKALSDIVLANPSNGTFSWIDNGFVCHAGGDYYQEMLFTPNEANVYFPVRNFVKVTATAIQRATISISATAVQTVTYDGNVKSFSHTSTPQVAGFTVTYKQNNVTKEPIEAGRYTVVITRPQDEQYEAVNKVFSDGLVIQQAEPEVAWPTKVTLILGDKLSDAVLEGEEGEGVFGWGSKGNEVPQNESEFTEKLIFTPTNSNYKTKEKSVTIHVKKRVNIVIDATPQSVVFDNTDKAFTVKPTIEGITGFTVGYAQKGNRVANPVHAGSYDVTITRPIDLDYNAFSQTISGGLVIEQAQYTGVIAWPEGLAGAIGKQLSGVVLPVVDQGVFSWKDPDTELVAGDQQVVVIFTPTNINYKPKEEDVVLKGLEEIIIDKAVQEVSYDGDSKSFVVKPTPSISLDAFTVTYSSGGSPVDMPVNAGKYDVRIVRERNAADNYLALDITIGEGLVITPIAYPEDLAAQIPWPETVACYTNRRLSSVTLAAVATGKFSWEDGNLSFSTPGDYTASLIFTPANRNYTAVNHKVLVKVTAEPTPPPTLFYKVEIKTPTGGRLSVREGSKEISTGSWVEEFTVLSLVATPNTGYGFKHFLINGEVYEENEATITGDVVIEAVFTTAVANEDIGTNEDTRFYVRQGVLYVETAKPSVLQVISITGTVVYKEDITGYKAVRNLSKGIYFLVVADKTYKVLIR